MTTVADLIELTRRQLAGSHRGQSNFLSLVCAETDTAITVADDTKGIVPGAILGIDDEILYVRSVNLNSKTATVRRGWLGTTAADHLADAVVDVSPRWTRVDIKQALLDELRSWGSGIFRVESFEVPIASLSRVVDLSFLENDWLNILAVSRTPRPGSDTSLRAQFRTMRHTADYPEGVLYLEQAVPEGVTIAVTVARPFLLDPWNDDIDLVDDVGLATTMLDIPPIGASWRLLGPREMSRLDPGSQGEPRSAQEVQGGMIAAVARGYKALRDTRLADEAYRLRTQYAWRM